MPRNNPEDGKNHFKRDGSLRSRNVTARTLSTGKSLHAGSLVFSQMVRSTHTELSKSKTKTIIINIYRHRFKWCLSGVKPMYVYLKKAILNLRKRNVRIYSQ